MEMSTELEGVSLLIIIALAIFHYDKLSRNNRRYQLYNLCLLVSGSAIAINILSCFTIERKIVVPLWLNMLINSVSFAAISLALAVMAGYAFFLLFEYNPDRSCLKRAVTVVMVFTVILLTLVVVNLWTGCYFYFDGTEYCRGPLNRIGFFALLIELVMLCICYWKYKHNVSPGIHQLMKAMPPLILTLVIAQLIFPDILLTGTLTAFTSIVFYACFQNNRIGRDALTEILNRSCFFQHLEIRKNKGQKQHIILLNLLNYSSVNRRFGMRQGDALLYIMARYLDDLDENYQAYRYGNTRFMLMGNFVSMQEAERIADKIHRRFLEGWEIGSQVCMIDTQLVHMVVEDEQTDANRLIDQFDYMLQYGKKNNGRNRNTITFFDERLKGMFDRSSFIFNEMRTALKEESFQIYFQPVYSCEEDAFTTAEVLLRLFASDGQNISPAEFIPLAEEKGLIDEISWMVLKKVCMFLSKYPDLPLQSVSMNMSIQQMMDRHIFDRIQNYKNQYGISSEKLRIEITESVVAENPTLVNYVMKSLLSDGIGFYLDDFGVGYSNLAGVMSLPFETVKLDRSLLQGIETSDKKYQTVDLLVRMLHNAGFQVVAEGLETREQVRKAKEISVDKIQGFYYARPMDEESFVAFLKENEWSKKEKLNNKIRII